MTGFNLMARAGQVDLVIGTSSSGDDSRTLTIPFGSLDSSRLPEAIKISIQAADGIAIPQADVACQAFKDAQGKVALGPTFSESSSASLGSNPIRLGSILCSDAISLQRHIGGGNSTNGTASAGQATPSIGNTPLAAVSSTESMAGQQSQSPQSIAAIPSAGDSKPKTLSQLPATSIATVTKGSSALSAVKTASESLSTALASSDQLASISPSARQPVGAKTSSPAAAQQTKSGVVCAYNNLGWSLKKVMSVVLVIVCFLR